jgi:hypothetical protein
LLRHGVGKSVALSPSIRHLVAFGILAAFAKDASACQCGATYHTKNERAYAQKVVLASTVIFEGTPIEFEFRWSLLSAKEGELVPCDGFWHQDVLRSPHMVITFQVVRAYQGSLGSEVQVHTGVGGGDCGANYAPGLNYLVFTGGSSSDQLSTSRCSPGGWIGNTEVSAELRFLRKEKPTASDLAPIPRWSDETANQKAQRENAWKEGQERYTAATGRICGSVSGGNAGPTGGAVIFLSTLGHSPFTDTDANVNDDGSFCSLNLGPGKYYLFLRRESEKGSTALYYPGVADLASATPIEVTPGQTRSSLAFKVTEQNRYSVRGFVNWSDYSALTDDISVALVRADGDRSVWYHATSTHLLPGLAYFKIENVLPGLYAAFVQGESGWMTRKHEVQVTNHSKIIALDLVKGAKVDPTTGVPPR